MDIQKRIDNLCEQRGWSYYELSVQAGISANTVYSWKKKEIIPTVPMIERICVAFNITLEQFFCGFVGELTSDEKQLLEDWHSMSDLEKDALKELMQAFKMIKREKNI